MSAIVAPTYWDIQAVSNSDTTALARAYNAVPDNRAELEDIFNFGSLVDAMLSEEWKVNKYERSLLQDNGSKIFYDADVFAHAVRLAEHCKKDPVIAQILKQMIGQYIFVRTMQITYEADTFDLRCKCKFDAFGKSIEMGADYKTTACTSLKQFREAIDFFQWDKQAAWYMDLARIRYHWIIGVSKKNGQIFKHAIERGDDAYNSGKQKYELWAFRWKLLGMDTFLNYSNAA